VPIYDFLCKSCGCKDADVFFHSWKYSDVDRKCPSCGAIMVKCISTGVVADIFPAEGIYLEHVSAEGKTFYSKQEMRQFEKTHDMTIGMIH